MKQDLSTAYSTKSPKLKKAKLSETKTKNTIGGNGGTNEDDIQFNTTGKPIVPPSIGV